MLLVMGTGSQKEMIGYDNNDMFQYVGWSNQPHIFSLVYGFNF